MPKMRIFLKKGCKTPQWPGAPPLNFRWPSTAGDSASRPHTLLFPLTVTDLSESAFLALNLFYFEKQHESIDTANVMLLLLSRFCALYFYTSNFKNVKYLVSPKFFAPPPGYIGLDTVLHSVFVAFIISEIFALFFFYH